jgi:hypothetical protein
MGAFMNRLLRNLLAVTAGAMIIPSTQARIADWNFTASGDPSADYAASSKDRGISTSSTLTSSGGSVTLSIPNTDLSGVKFSAGQTLEPLFALSGAAGNMNGTLPLDNLSVSASGISPVPEPVNMALGILSGIFLIVIVARSRSIWNWVRRCWVAVEHWLDAV